MPQIVVLDGHTLSPGDLSWDRLAALGSLTVHEHTLPQDTVVRAQDAEILLTNKTVLSRAVLDQLPRCRYIGVLATGYNVVDTAAAAARGIPVTNVPAYGTRSVAQATFALLLELTNHVGHHAQTVRDGRWCRNRDFCYWDAPLVELDGRTLGLVGCGRIGQAVADIARAFGMQVLACDPAAHSAPAAGVRLTDLDTLLAHSDVVSLHCPLTASNAGLVNAERLARMQPSAFLLNTARGPLVNEVDLAAALNAERLAGAGLDVLAVEPPAADNPLLTARNCLITPHVAWATRQARARLLDTAVANVQAFLAGSPANVVNGVGPALTGPRPSKAAVLLSSPHPEADLALGRQRDPGREVNL